MIYYLDIKEVIPVSDPYDFPPPIRAEITGIEVADEADARVKLAEYTAYFEGLQYEAFFHEHYHEEGLPCRLTKL